MSTLELAHISVDRRRSPLQEVAWRVGELEYLVNCVTGLHRLFAEVGRHIRAAGWGSLRDHMAQMVQEPVYQHLAHELPHLLRSLRANVCVMIGVNLDEQFRPVAATLLSVNAQKYTSSTFPNRLLGNSGEDFKGLGPLHTVPDLPALNASTDGDNLIVSLVASRRDNSEESPHRSYKIAPGPPLGRSYAREIAAQYGISYEQLTALLQRREVAAGTLF